MWSFTILHSLLIGCHRLQQLLAKWEVTYLQQLLQRDSLGLPQGHKKLVSHLSIYRSSCTFRDVDVKLNVSNLLRVIAHNLSCPTNDIEVASHIIILLHILDGLVSTINDKLTETLQNIKQRHGGVLCLLGIERTARTRYSWFTLQRTIYSRYILKEFQLIAEQVTDTDIRRVVCYLLWNLTTLIRFIPDNTIEPTPLIAEIIPTHIVRQTILRTEQHTLGTRTHDEVIHRDKSVHVSLLVNHVFNKAVNLAINKWIELKAVWMLAMSIRSLALSKNITERRKVVEMPVIIHEPLGFNQRNILFHHASSHTSSDSVSVLGIYNISLVLNINLEIVTIIVVMASVSRLTLLSPNLNHSAERRIGRIHKVNGLRVELTESLSAVCNHEITVSRQSVNLLQLSSLSRRLGKLSQHVANGNVMHLTQTTHVPSTEIPHIVVYEEIVRVHVAVSLVS